MEPERTVYDMIEVLPGPPAIPTESDDSEEATVEDENIPEEEDKLQTVTTDAREASLGPESTPHPQQTQMEAQLPPRRRVPPARYESEVWTSHAAFLMTTVSSSTEPRTYQEAVNHPL
jgi:hypothetical protein